jgi:hypothetical protein
MKRLYLSLVSVFVAASVHAATVSLLVAPASMTNIFMGSALISQIYWTSSATGSSNSYVTIVDTPTNLLTYVQSPYTNTLTYATNYVWNYTNYYGIATTNTNFAIIDIPQTVAQSTNNYPSASFAAASGTTFNANNPNMLIKYGLWATNTSAANCPGTLTIVYTSR